MPTNPENVDIPLSDDHSSPHIGSKIVGRTLGLTLTFLLSSFELNSGEADYLKRQNQLKFDLMNETARLERLAAGEATEEYKRQDVYIYRVMGIDPANGLPLLADNLEPKQTFSKHLGGRSLDLAEFTYHKNDKQILGTDILTPIGIPNKSSAGMSANESPYIPSRNIGDANYAVFRIRVDEIIRFGPMLNGLGVNYDGRAKKDNDHVGIQPIVKMDANQFQQAIRLNRTLWQKVDRKYYLER